MGAHLHLGALAAALLANAATQVGTCRGLTRLGWFLTFVAGCGAGLAVLAALELGILLKWRPPPAEFLGAALAVAGAYCGYSLLYFCFINGGRTALRVRLLYELEGAPGGLTKADLLERYRPDEVIERRFERLLAHGQLVLRDGRYHIGQGSMLLISRLVTFAKRVVIGRPSEFE